MKKFVSVLMALVMVLSLAACGGNNNADASNNDTASATTVASALEVLETIWSKYGEDEKFAVIGGNMESPVDGAPGNYDMAYAENLTYNLLVPAESLASVDEAATMIHMMNANTFTSGVVHLTEGTDVAAFVQTMREAVQNNQWMCGFPETLVIAVIDNAYVLVAFGVNDAMTPFQTHLAEAFANADVQVNEAIG